LHKLLIISFGLLFIESFSVVVIGGCIGYLVGIMTLIGIMALYRKEIFGIIAFIKDLLCKRGSKKEK